MDLRVCVSLSLVSFWQYQPPINPSHTHTHTNSHTNSHLHTLTHTHTHSHTHRLMKLLNREILHKQLPSYCYGNVLVLLIQHAGFMGEPFHHTTTPPHTQS